MRIPDCGGEAPLDLRVAPLPGRGEVFPDARGQSRALRLAWHDEQGVVVLTIWRDDQCAASFRLPVGDVPDLVSALVAGLAAAPPAVPTVPTALAALAALPAVDPRIVELPPVRLPARR